MKIVINTDDSLQDTEIQISCRQLTPQIEKILSTLRIMDKQLTAVKNGETYIIDAEKVLYIESVDKKTFIYTSDEVYETNLKLYELEEQLSDYGFIRAGKSFIIHIKHIKSLKSDIDRRIRVTMKNDEQLIVSRQYADDLKKRLGVK